MDVVIDTSAIIAVIVNEPQKAKLIEATEGMGLIAPRSVHWEIGNAFSAMLKRKRITPEQAASAIRIYESIPVRLVDVELAKSLDIASALNIFAYDAYLLRCALRHAAPLITLDGDLARCASEMKIRTIEVMA
ncbi:MAG: type II toxin-antitoxin system VapC family toxin [Dehalococcoidia bacterium]|nr:type II toxin-antitoxin system VapC family toxin [Dehalococcoidia bacterium]